MATVLAVSDSLASALTVVPRVGPGVCDICHGAPGSGWSRCWSCAETTSRVSRPVEHVVPISLYRPLLQLHYVLRKYKDHPQERARHELSGKVAAVLARFLIYHGDCIAKAAGHQWDYIATVPSTHARPGPRPLERAIARVEWLEKRHRHVLEAGPTPVVRLKPKDDNFKVSENVDGDRILLVDDTFTSGTSVQAAASALQLAGAHVPAAVTVGRFIKPGFSEESQALWESVERLPFDFDVCCLH